MARQTIEQLRVPIGIVVVVLAAFLLFPRGDDGEEAAASPSPEIIAGEPGGEVITPEPEPTDTPEPTPIPTVEPVETPEPTPEPTPQPTPQPTPAPPADGFTAEVLACRSISGQTCNQQLGILPAGASTFTALVRFTSANAGDTINAILTGPAGTIPGGPFTLQGGGNGYYYSTFQASNLPAGDYVVTATRNGNPVATTSFTKAGS
jgi:hypothetical protein